MLRLEKQDIEAVLCLLLMSIFSYDSKFNEVMGFIADLFITNVIFLLCCLPIVTIGAAQTGLHTAMRVLQDPKDERSVLKAFFRGFKSGFFTVTVNHVIFLVLDGILLYTLWVAYTNRDAGLFVHWAFPLVMLILCLVIHALLPAFHSRFGCRMSQLFRNCILLFISHPLRALCVGALTWAPMAMFYLAPALFRNISAVFLCVYYSVAFLFCVVLLNKPFDLLIQDTDPDEAIEEVK